MTESCEHVVQSPYGIAIAGSATCGFDPCPWCEIKALSSKLDEARKTAEAQSVAYQSVNDMLNEAQSRLHQLSEDHSHCEDLLHELGRGLQVRRAAF